MHLYKSFQIRRCQTLHHTRPVLKPRPINPICVLKHAIFQRDDNKLTSLKPRLDKPSDILRVRQIERGVDFVQDVHGRWFEL